MFIETKPFLNERSDMTSLKKYDVSYTQKIVSMWCYPLFQSIWIGPILDTENNVHDTFFLSLYDHGTVNRFINRYMKCFVIIIFLPAISDINITKIIAIFCFSIFWVVLFFIFSGREKASIFIRMFLSCYRAAHMYYPS